MLGWYDAIVESVTGVASGDEPSATGAAAFEELHATVEPALESAGDLGTTPWKAFWLITVPLSKAGIIAGSMLVFIPSVGEYVIPDLLGGPRTLMIARVLWEEYFNNNDWPMASAVAVIMVGLILIPLVLLNRYQGGVRGGSFDDDAPGPAGAAR